MERIATEFTPDCTQRFVRRNVFLGPRWRRQKQKPNPDSPHQAKLNSALTDCPSAFCIAAISQRISKYAHP
jgi:hypothetical protein